MSASGPLECEIKIPVSGLQPVRRRLLEAGAELLHCSSREHNTLYDLPMHTLATSGQALRLRRYGDSWLLTFKGTAEYRGQVKTREELQLQVDDGATLAEILQRLGLTQSVCYEKDRELWQLEDIEVALDHTPMGDFVELEGPADELSAAAQQLGLDPDAAIRGSYLSLWQRYRQERGDELPEDMLLDHD